MFKKRNPAAMRGANPASLAQVLIAVGIERKHTKVWKCVSGGKNWIRENRFG